MYLLFALFKQLKIWSNITFAFIFLSSAVRAKKIQTHQKHEKENKI